MGQQQLLLIVLGVIIVGIAIVVGINLFNANAVSSNRDAVTSDLQNLAAMAHQYYVKPSAMGGGENSYVGIKTDNAWLDATGLSSNANGTYTTSAAGTATSVEFTGVGKQPGVTLYMKVFVPPIADSISTTP